MQDLFASNAPETSPSSGHAPNAPLADRLRPKSLAEVIGQDHLVGVNGSITRMIDAGRLSSMILWGPPGVGKTTIARLLADATEMKFVQISAIFSGVSELRKVFDQADITRQTGRGTLLFVDEIHRFNRAQQDSFLPHMESGLITLIGATTENPSFELNGAVLSRAQVFTLNRLSTDDLEQMIQHAENALGNQLPLTPPARAQLINMADGDGRFCLNMVEELSHQPDGNEISPEDLQAILQRRAPLYDKSQEGHYNLISALHKSVRGSDPDAALYWLCRMLDGGEDPLYLARRLVRMANEDIGLADPMAMQQCLAAKETYEFLGSPEGELALAQAVLYLATAPKSNAVYTAYKGAMKLAKSTGSLMPPPHAMNAPTKLMKSQGYSDGYIYDHDQPNAFAGLNYFPPDMERPDKTQNIYDPTPRGYEKELRKRIDFWADKRKD